MTFALPPLTAECLALSKGPSACRIRTETRQPLSRSKDKDTDDPVEKVVYTAGPKWDHSYKLDSNLLGTYPDPIKAKVGKARDPTKDEPWKPLPVFDRRLTEAHEEYSQKYPRPVREHEERANAFARALGSGGSGTVGNSSKATRVSKHDQSLIVQQTATTLQDRRVEAARTWSAPDVSLPKGLVRREDGLVTKPGAKEWLKQRLEQQRTAWPVPQDSDVRKTLVDEPLIGTLGVMTNDQPEEVDLITEAHGRRKMPRLLGTLKSIPQVSARDRKLGSEDTPHGRNVRFSDWLAGSEAELPEWQPTEAQLTKPMPRRHPRTGNALYSNTETDCDGVRYEPNEEMDAADARPTPPIGIFDHSESTYWLEMERRKERTAALKAGRTLKEIEVAETMALGSGFQQRFEAAEKAMKASGKIASDRAEPAERPKRTQTSRIRPTMPRKPEAVACEKDLKTPRKRKLSHTALPTPPPSRTPSGQATRAQLKPRSAGSATPSNHHAPPTREASSPSVQRFTRRTLALKDRPIGSLTMKELEERRNQELTDGKVEAVSLPVRDTRPAISCSPPVRYNRCFKTPSRTPTPDELAAAGSKRRGPTPEPLSPKPEEDELVSTLCFV